MSPLARKKNKKTKKKKSPTPTPKSTSYPALPNDLLLSCLARVSRLHYPALSHVSKSFRSLLASPELYKERSLLGHTESCLYVCLWYYSDWNPKWFTLCRKPDQTLTSKKKKSGGYVLAKVPILHSPPVNKWNHGLVAVGSSIYNIGGSTSSSSVSVLDCTSHTWSEGPSFRVKLESLTASVVDRKIYVAGCYDDGVPYAFTSSTIEVLDTETQIWDPLPIPWVQRSCNFYYQITCIDGKFHLQSKTETASYNSKERRWDLVGPNRMYPYLSPYSYCDVDNVLYSVSNSEVLRWYDIGVNKWRKLEGLVGLPKFPQGARVRLADYGGKMAVLWDVHYYDDLSHETMIWCAEIALERRKNCEIWGKVEWFGHVLTIPVNCHVLKVLAATVYE